MLFKLSVNNIRKSLRDYAIYFFTLIIGVSVFYVFNAIGGQAAYMQVTESRKDIIELLTTMLSGVSVFVAGVLGLLIVYASRFLMKRRNKEFALYMMLGMSKGRISTILLIETILIGLGSLGVGLIIGIGLSQLMSALVANLFEADMTAYQFSISSESVGKTVLYFGIMYLVVMIFNSVVISRLKLIDLIQSGKKSEQIKLKNLILCVLIFILAVIALGYAYYQVGWNSKGLNQQKMAVYIAIGAVSTFLIFWSVSGMLLKLIMSMKKVYFKNLNSFTFRQISSKVNTMVFSMTVICLMLFVTICTLSGAFTIRNSMNANLNAMCPVDIEIEYQELDHDTNREIAGDIISVYSHYGYDLTEKFSQYVDFHTYETKNFTFGDSLGSRLEELKQQFPFLEYETPEIFVKLSDYNALMRLYGREEFSLQDDEFILLCDFKSMKAVRDETLSIGTEISIFGHTLKSKYNECQDGFIDISSQHINAGIFVIPDNIADETFAGTGYLMANYQANTKEEKSRIEEICLTQNDTIRENLKNDIENGTMRNRFYMNLNTRIDIAEATVGLGAMITFLGLYIGLVFLIACGAILALKELSESVDSIPRYTMLRKIGVNESDISKSLFQQTGIFFLLPLLLACIHSVFGMKFATVFLEVFGTEEMAESIIATSIMILLIYGGYFLITYYCSKNIIKDRK
ncbi:MAG: ABC transporter permease [Lachnospiraceae bacterium]|nr:ABC transporter permease [Lachnospiraceae bacterium]